MAATTTTGVELENWPELVTYVDVSTIDPGVSLDISHGGPSGVPVKRVTHEVTTVANDRSGVFVSHVRASDSTDNDTARVVIDTVPLGDLTGAVVRVYFHFQGQASGGISA